MEPVSPTASQSAPVQTIEDMTWRIGGESAVHRTPSGLLAMNAYPGNRSPHARKLEPFQATEEKETAFQLAAWCHVAPSVLAQRLPSDAADT